jgi:integrase
VSTKRRGRGEGGLYQRADGLWVGVVDLGYIDGKRRRRTVTAKRKQDCIIKLNALKARVAAGKVGDGSTLTSAWLTYWLDDISTARESTKATYRGYINNWIVPHIGHLRLDRVQPEHVRSLLAKMETAGKAPATRKQVRAILVKAFGLALKEGKVIIDPTATVDAPSLADQKTHGRLTTADAKKALRHIQTLDLRRRTRWSAALLLGIRQGEALGLAWHYVNLDEGTIVIEESQTRTKGKLVLSDVKSRSSHRTLNIGLMPTFAGLLRDYRAESDGDLVWGPLDNKADWKEWQAILKAAGVDGHPVHSARATTASLLEELGHSRKVISEIMGHATEAVTEKHYISGDVESQGRAFASMDALLLED